ncbi:MarR family winged helix-turn-helix transcriptional regulator [Domibacillus epiphyticus]|uniref:MarR family transcriptional regulator n=1 Tax=Domibacillus epiphyticus TaxID=1714355 RepID=A0A1V2ABN4_9BACI|nr:MarR family transcriptional regulator [Domibacillus epiphyticus]OMP68408.1 MarR family transcriptional regulator [Domibacillus epiphyticus]
MKVSLTDYISITIHQTDLKLTSWVKEKLAPFNLAPEQNLIMMLLWEKDGLTQNEIAEKLDKDKTNVTRMLGSLEQKGFIKRTMSPSDRRSLHVCLTNKGKKLECEIIPITEEFHRMVTKDITEEELREMSRILLKMRQNVQ